MKKTKKTHPAMSSHSNYFEEAAKPIFAFFETLCPEQKILILKGGSSLIECYKTHLFETELQSTLSEKTITTRKLKI